MCILLCESWPFYTYIYTQAPLHKLYTKLVHLRISEPVVGMTTVGMTTVVMTTESDETSKSIDSCTNVIFV